MLMDTKNAKSCLCPFTLAANPKALQKAGYDVNFYQKCIGEKCMAWRFVDAHENLGYCGLAGKPFGVQ